MDESEPSDEAARLRTEEDRALLRGGCGDLPAAPAHRIAGVHTANVLVVRLWPGRDVLATGSGEETGGRCVGQQGLLYMIHA